MANLDIRAAAVSAGVRLWRVADALGIADASLSRKLRKELPQEEKEKIFSIIRELSQEVSYGSLQLGNHGIYILTEHTPVHIRVFQAAF